MIHTEKESDRGEGYIAILKRKSEVCVCYTIVQCNKPGGWEEVKQNPMLYEHKESLLLLGVYEACTHGGWRVTRKDNVSSTCVPPVNIHMLFPITTMTECAIPRRMASSCGEEGDDGEGGDNRGE